MTLRSIQWIADSGLLVGLTTIGEFAPPTMLAALSLSAAEFTLTVPASGSVIGATAGSALSATSLPAGLIIGATGGWIYDGSGVVGSYVIVLIETLVGSVNSPRTTSIAVTMVAPDAALDFSQSANSGLIAAMRSF